MKRYFHASFSHDRGFGSIQYISNNGKYPPAKELKKAFMQEDITHCIIINVFELTEEDFNNFIS
jgi:hypothetical protein